MQVDQVNIPSLGGWHLALRGRRSFRWDHAGRLSPVADDVAEQVEETTAWKPLTDVVLQGHVYSRNGDATIARLEVSDRAHSVRATGDRSIVSVRGAGCEFSRAAAFERIPLVWERAYGGVDSCASAAAGELGDADLEELRAHLNLISDFAYPRNPLGTGFWLQASAAAAVGTLVPNLDDPEDPVTEERMLRAAPEDWADAPFPACWDWKGLATFPRSLLLGQETNCRQPTRPFRELRLGALVDTDLAPRGDEEVKPESFLPMGLLREPRSLLGAAPGLATDRLVGGETMRLVNLEPGAPERVFTLPRDAPTIRLRPPGCGWYELEPQLDTVVIRPDEQQLTLVYSGKLRVAGRYPDDELALVEAGLAWSAGTRQGR